ncbi:2-oxo-tetronate isomerase [Aquibium sp. ELW1220]|uniref:2-oxo-tetronate isomerase n=1 Tax=Aquibium sp. ELW1220 TaxID=2976766 RepID=UPI0025AFE26E|nr:2-oxo-tetronate isomerase [Aquibium sp. ELW1220]MDN2582028.1 hydroxypyruvate isomerase family protein [Aquibium sp. ELW1220]
MPKLAANLSTMFNETPFLERFERAARAGFSAVEFQFPYAFDPDAIGAELKRNRLEIALFNLPPGDIEAGERGLASIPEARERFRESLEPALRHALATGCRKLHCMAGVLSGQADMAEREATFVANLREATALFWPHGVRLLIEPLNPFDTPNYFLSSVEQAAAIVEAVGSPGVGIQYDFYHQSRMRGELIATFDRFRNLIGHVQIAGNPGRHEPDTGEVDYRFVLQALVSRGYDGFVGCEYTPAGDTVAGLGWARSWLKADVA